MMMRSDVASLFPTLVMKFTDVLSKEEIDRVFTTIKGEKAGDHEALIGAGVSSYNNGGGVSSFSRTDDVLSRLNIHEQVQQCLDEYCGVLHIRKVSFTNSWFNIQDVGSTLRMHHHPDSALSGALYINADENSSPLCFENPNQLGVFQHWNPVSPSEYNCEFVAFQPRTAEMIVFPSWLRHGSMDRQNQTVDRTVISFNTEYKKEHLTK